MSAEKPSRNHDGRKSSKPLMEKKRRARINDCLMELQSILDSLNPESGSSRQNKREKADILEQTVKYVKQLRQLGSRGNPPDPHAQAQFRAGYNQCVSTVTQFLSANQNSLNGEARTGLLSHLANSLQNPKPNVDHFAYPRRRADESTNGDSSHNKVPGVPPTSNQSEAPTSSMNIVHPMRATAAVVTSAPAHPPVAQQPAGLANIVPSAMPSVMARLELTQNGVNGSSATRLVPIGIPIKVQSPGQFVLVPSQMLNGGQITTPVVPVLSPQTATLAPRPASSAGSSGSVAISPVSGRQSPQKSPPQPQNVASTSGQGAIMYASCPASIGTTGGASTSALPSAMPYPVAFLAMGDPTENGAHLEQFVYPSRLENLPKLYLPLQANPPNDTEPVWRPW
ncbi:uncharacterized protein [Diadema setosum]|uniref:uncharacterized protein n=1 Tax=Diadema setosum TaxID=31175 RepID=UPI003B3A67E6